MTRDDVVDDVSPVCSAKGCRDAADWVLVWNNPKLHTPDRRKTWTACQAHREQLRQFLDARGFLRDTVPVAQWATGAEAEPQLGGSSPPSQR
jgi:hypothetical protein